MDCTPANGRANQEGSLSPCLRVIDLGKEFEFFAGPWGRLVQWASAGRLRRGERFTALADLSFSLGRGQALGVMGANGAGKSTLLKLVCRTLHPTTGKVEVNGRLASVLDLGIGFHPEFTGRQNIFFNARFMGLTDREIRATLEQIMAFSELGNFMDRPLRTYSAGMQMRLAFSVAAHVRPDLLVIDEALAVGDSHFIQKCLQRIRRFRQEGVSLLLATHDPGALKALCDEVLLLDHGREVSRGKPAEMLELYNDLIARHDGNRELLQKEFGGGRGPGPSGPWSLEAKTEKAPTPAVVRESGLSEGLPGEGSGGRPSASGAGSGRSMDDSFDKIPPHRAGNFRAVVRCVTLQDRRGRENRTFTAGEAAVLSIEVVFLDEVADPTVGFLIRDRLGNDVYGTNTHHQKPIAGRFLPGARLQVEFRLRLDLGPGEYSLTVASHTGDVHIHDSFDWIDRFLTFRILPGQTGFAIGTALLRPALTIRRPQEALPVVACAGLLEDLLGRPAARHIRMGQHEEKGLFSGWYPPEQQGQNWFAWTGERCSMVLDLRGDVMEIQAGTDSPAARQGGLPVQVHLLGRDLGIHRLDCSDTWTVLSIPIPLDCRVPAGLVRLRVEGWVPAEAGLGPDARCLGLRVRQVTVRQAIEQAPRISDDLFPGHETPVGEVASRRETGRGR